LMKMIRKIFHSIFYLMVIIRKIFHSTSLITASVLVPFGPLFRPCYCSLLKPLSTLFCLPLAVVYYTSKSFRVFVYTTCTVSELFFDQFVVITFLSSVCHLFFRRLICDFPRCFTFNAHN
jgi:hypothetical protein